MAERCLRTAVEACSGTVELWCTPDALHPFFLACRSRFGVRLRVQRGADLGARMADALHRRFPALVMGSDCPSVTVSDLRAARQALESGADAVLGPARDGGYVLLGLSRPIPGLFRSMPWGSGSVLDETRARLRGRGLRWHELPVRWDVDRPADLRELSRLDGWADVLDVKKQSIAQWCNGGGGEP